MRRIFKKIFFISLAFLLLAGLAFGFFAIRFYNVDNGRIILKDGKLFAIPDVGFSSFYMYKDAGEKLCRGPIWDYDLAAGNSVEVGAASPLSIYAGEANPWYARLLDFSKMGISDGLFPFYRLQFNSKR